MAVVPQVKTINVYENTKKSNYIYFKKCTASRSPAGGELIRKGKITMETEEVLAQIQTANIYQNTTRNKHAYKKNV